MASTKSCVAYRVRYGLIFLMLHSAKWYDSETDAAWSDKDSWSSITPRMTASFLQPWLG